MVRPVGPAGNCGLGTFEFLVLGGEFWFIEANPRLQVEHTITEEITGVDLVQAQIRIALGETLADLGLSEPPGVHGASIQARLNLETLLEEGLAVPGAGTLAAFVIPSGPGVRVDTFGYPGYTTSLRYDSLLAKVIARADDFPAAARRAYMALSEFRIEGVPTNRALLQGVLKHPGFLRGSWNTGFIADHLTDLLQSGHRDLFFSDVSKSSDGGPAIAPAEVPAGLAVVPSPLPGTVLTVDVELGDRVAVGSRVAVLEAMKMEHVVRSESAGVVRAVLVAPGDTLLDGVGMVALEPADVSADGQAIQAGPEADRADWSAEVAEIGKRRQAALAMGASGGGSVKMVSDAGYTYVPVLPGWDAVVENLSLVPVVSACLGPTVGLGARAVMSHLTIAVEGKGQVFTAGPPVVRGATGEVLTPEQLGGVDVHRHSGAVDRFGHLARDP